MSSTDQDIVAKISALLKDAGERADAFGRSVGLHCKNGCGKCCEKPEVETTVSEMMPLAVHLWQTGGAEEVLALIKQGEAEKENPKPCVFFKADPLVAGHGRCAVYEYRPGVCRLFSFAARRDKTGQKQLVACKVIKENFPADYARAQQAISDGKDVPLMGDHAFNVGNIDPVWGKEQMPINHAVRIALERVGQWRDLGHFS